MDSARSHACGGLAGHVSVLDLPWLERTLLWSIRTWAAYHDAPQSVHGALERVFIDAGIQSALVPFAKLMKVIFADAQICPDIRCVRCLRLGRDEARLLFVLTAIQTEPAYNIELLLSDVMQPAAARIAAGAALSLMRVIANAGLLLQQTQHTGDAVSWPPGYQVWNTTR